MSDDKRHSGHALPLKVLLVTLRLLVLQLGLAILGWGGFALFFSHPPLVALAVATLVMAVASVLSGASVSRGAREDRSNRWVLGATVTLAILHAYVPAYTDRHDIWTIGGEAVRWVGVALFVLGGVLRLWPVFVLGRRFSILVAIQKDHKLVTTGIYQKVRNPSYLGMLVGALGWALAFRSVPGIVITALFLIPLSARMRSEERLLGEHFGVEYAKYRARTWRLLPGVY